MADVLLHQNCSRPGIPYAGCHCWLCSLVREMAAMTVKPPAPFYRDDSEGRC